MRFELYRGEDRQWRWRLLSENNRIIANGGEGYHNYGDMVKSIDLVKSVDDSTPIEVVSSS